MPYSHTRAQLVAIARQYKPLPTDGYDPDPDDVRVPPRFVEQVVQLLRNEDEDELKNLLKSEYDIDEETVEQCVLDLMHKHHDDEAGVPFLFPYPDKETHFAALVASPLAAVFRRPHTPLTSPLGPVAATSYMTAKAEYSPQSSPVLPHAPPQFTSSLPASPLSSPRLLNAKATEFKPIPRPLSAASSNPAGLRAETPSPDMWSHSPLRSNLAIAAPLIPERSLTPSSSLRSSMLLGDDDDEDNDPFDPFGKSLPHSFHSLSVSDYDTQWSTSSNNSSRSPESLDSLHANFSDASGFSPPEDPAEMEAAAAAMLTEGMTPFDVLSSVFGSTLAPSELEEALAANGYDFDRAMAWLIDRAVPTVPQQAPPQLRIQQMGGRVTVVARDPVGRGRGTQDPRGPPRYVNGRPAPGGNRVCRYFVAGECLRADCRFSHDLERALCRFWLRGTCAKQDNCEFLHHLPKDVDMSSLSAAMSRANVPPGTGPLAMHTAALAVQAPPDDFPALGVDGNKGRRGPYPYNDPGRTRFATAVKKQQPVAAATSEREVDPTLAARREAMGYGADNLYHRSAIVAPRASPRLKLRPPSLLPTLPTGEAVQSLYMAYRARALQLGAARNACLSRAADAWRRGDGAAAKRFSREGHELNEKMGKEMAIAAAKLVRERARVTEQAVRQREAGWSDDPGDRAARGKSLWRGPRERTECVLDLHGLHANEATEVLEEFLLALEHEHFYGLAYVIVGEEKHTGTQDAGRGASRARLATGVREWVHRWGYPWSERDGIICVDALTHASE
ncbi:hypothetical protein MSAN_00715900 [Mycena sanguinolenta]|uniref:Uncharacterized protein n=1 Tax=Mycena sanguinolenta TaxID=230812 RepID=A0A8H6Z231_9AGAR|nr:hypothetical protein MSAN_00715900 [Mycena sanguinolenta]